MTRAQFFQHFDLLAVGDFKRAAGQGGRLGGFLSVHEQLQPAVASHRGQMLPARAQVAVVSDALACLQGIAQKEE